MNSPDTQFKLRLPARLKQCLEQQADVAGRSLSAEIVHRLEQSLGTGNTGAPGTLGLRAEIAARREVHQATADMLARSVDRLYVLKEQGGDEPYPGKASGKSVEEALAAAEDALSVFRALVDSATLLLSELAVSEATGSEIDVVDFRSRARRYGVLPP